MSDGKLRELERRWRETGSVDDEAAYMRERVRAGELTQERLDFVSTVRTHSRQLFGEGPASGRSEPVVALGRPAIALLACAIGRLTLRKLRDPGALTPDPVSLSRPSDWSCLEAGVCLTPLDPSDQATWKPAAEGFAAVSDSMRWERVLGPIVRSYEAALAAVIGPESQLSQELDVSLTLAAGFLATEDELLAEATQVALG